MHSQLRLTLCDPMDCSSPDSSVHETSRQEYWSGLPFPLPGDLPDSGTEPASLALHLLRLLHWQVDSSPLSHLGSSLWKGTNSFKNSRWERKEQR